MLTDGSAKFVVILIKLSIDVGIVVNWLNKYVPGNLVMIIGVPWDLFQYLPRIGTHRIN